jgi:MHS family alpha-ketoglutarate permease-like MFS transporter
MTAAAAADASPSAAPTLSFGRRLRSIFGGAAGNLIEWYDWFAYSAFSLYFAPVFFPEGDDTAQLLQTAAVFAVGFLMRPVGGWLLGVYADRAGRKAALTLSVLMMCFGSLLIAIAPGYATIGAAAPVLLLVARLLQGLSVGGEYGASATYVSEMAGKNHRGFWSSFLFMTLILGQLLALGVLIVLQNTLSDAALESWGWRIPFFIGAAGALSVLWLRRNIDETTEFKRADHDSTLRKLMQHPVEVAMVAALTMGGSLAFYAYTTYMQKFLVNTTGFTKPEATSIMAAALFAYMLMQPLAGALSDKLGRRPLMIAFGVLGTLLTVPLMTAISTTTSPLAAFGLICLLLAGLSCYTSISAVFKTELFPAGIRALGVGLPYAAANAVFGGTAEYVALWFKQAGRESLFFWYVALCVAGTLVVAIRMRDTKARSLIRDD